MGCGCRSYVYTSKPKPNPDPEPKPDSLSCPPGQRRTQTRAGGVPTCEPDINLGQCTEFEILVDGICTAVTECVPPAVRQSDGSCQIPQTFSNNASVCRDDEVKVNGVCVPNNASSCTGGQTWDDMAKACVASVCLPGQKRDAIGDCSTECEAPLSWGGLQGVCLNPDGTEYIGGAPRCLEGEAFDSATNRCRKRCPTALEVYDEALGRCIHDVSKGDCPAGEVLDQNTGSCKKRCLPPKIELQGLGCVDPCQPGQIRQPNGCVWPPCPPGFSGAPGSCIRDSTTIFQCTNPDPLKCAECTKSNVPYTGTFSAFGDGSRIKEYFDRAGIPFGSIDSIVCDKAKETALDYLVDILGMTDDLSDLADDFFPDWLSNMVDGAGSSTQVEKWSVFARSSILFGRGQFDEAVAGVFELIPDVIYEAGKSFATHLLDAAGLQGKSLNSLTPAQKELVLDNYSLAVSPLTIAFPLAAPIFSLMDAFILLGRKQWDEAAEVILTLGAGKYVKLAISVLMGVVHSTLAVINSGMLDNAAEAAPPLDEMFIP